jgi:hypothetical protein
MNEIVTFGKNYKLTPGIKVFIQSAARFCDKLTVICSNLSEDLNKFLKDQKVNIVDATSLSSKHGVDDSLSPYTLKVIYFYLYSKYYCQSNRIYMCDFTDLCFQKNVFEIVQTNCTYVTSENFVIGNCDTNKTWVNICYNPDIYNLIKGQEILNGGSIFGATSSVVATLKEMCADMTQIISRIGNYQNIDQASLNKVVYFDQFRYKILRDLEIANIAHVKNKTPMLKKDEVTFDGVCPYVLHQYDVIKPLEKFLYEQFN